MFSATEFNSVRRFPVESAPEKGGGDGLGGGGGGGGTGGVGGVGGVGSGGGGENINAPGSGGVGGAGTPGSGPSGAGGRSGVPGVPGASGASGASGGGGESPGPPGAGGSVPCLRNRPRLDLELSVSARLAGRVASSCPVPDATAHAPKTSTASRVHRGVPTRGGMTRWRPTAGGRSSDATFRCCVEHVPTSEGIFLTFGQTR